MLGRDLNPRHSAYEADVLPLNYPAISLTKLESDFLAGTPRRYVRLRSSYLIGYKRQRKKRGRNTQHPLGSCGQCLGFLGRYGLFRQYSSFSFGSDPEIRTPILGFKGPCPTVGRNRKIPLFGKSVLAFATQLIIQTGEVFASAYSERGTNCEVKSVYHTSVPRVNS